MLPNTMVDLDRVIASSPVVVLWGEPLEHRPVDFVTENVGQFGYTVPEMVMEEVRFDAIVYPEDRERVRSAFQDALSEGRNVLVMDYRIFIRSGEVRWVEDRVTFHRDETGKAILYQASLLDITERKTAEIRLRESEERLARVLSSASVGVWEYVPERDELIGGGRASLFGMHEDEIPRSRKELWDRIIPPEGRERLENAWREVCEGRTEFLELEHKILKVDGAAAWLLTKGFPVRDEDGRLLYLQGVTVDITPLKLAEEEVVHQNERLALLHAMSMAFMEELDTGALIRRILEKAVELVGSPNGLIGVIEEYGGYLKNMWGLGLYEGVVGNRVPVSTGLFAEVLKSKKRVLVDDYREYAGRLDIDAYKNITTVIALPLHRGESLLGAVAIAYTDTVRKVEEQLLLVLDQFAAAASIALENARLYEDARREVEEREKTEERLRFHQALVEAAAEGASFLLSIESEEQAIFFALRALGQAVETDGVAVFRNNTDSEGSPFAEVLAKAAICGNEVNFVLPNRVYWATEFVSIYESLSDGMPFHGTIAFSGAEECRSAIPDSFVTVTMIPVFIRARFWGVLAFCFQRDRPPFETDEIDVLRAAAYNVAASVIRWESEREVKKGYDELRKTFSDVIRTMGQIVGKKDPYTIEHQERVAALALEIGSKMGLSEERCEGLRIAGLVHDIGKIEIPGEILSKPGKLSPIEFELIKTHARSGYDILREVDFPWPVAEIAHQHHERLNGSGYPRGLKGEEILLEARILAVADVVESMMSHRPYRPSLGTEAALKEITEKRGVLYDAEAVDACMSLLGERPDLIVEM